MKPRPAIILLIILLVLAIVDTGIFFHHKHGYALRRQRMYIFDIATAGLGLTDLCIATEARYTRHPAISDHVVPFMDHPGAIEHFPSGSFWAPPPLMRNNAQSH